MSECVCVWRVCGWVGGWVGVWDRVGNREVSLAYKYLQSRSVTTVSYNCPFSPDVVPY